MEHYDFTNFSKTREDLIDGKYSAQDLCAFYLKKATNEDSYNAFLEVFSESALELAKGVDESIKSGSTGRLAGAIIGIKDNMCYAGHKVSASSKILEGFESLFTATAVQRLIDEGGDHNWPIEL